MQILFGRAATVRRGGEHAGRRLSGGVCVVEAGLGLLEIRGGHAQIGIGCERLVHERIQVRIVVQAPPVGRNGLLRE